MSVKRYIKINKPIEVDDLVRCTRDDAGARVGHIRKVSHADIDNQIFFCYHGLGMPHLKHYWEPVIEETEINKRRRAEMKQEVAEMMVELMERAEGRAEGTTLAPRIYHYSNSYKTTRIYLNDFECYEAKPPVNETWDTLTGVYVALCRVTGRELPDWFYGEEKEKTEMSKEITLEDVLRAWRNVEPGLTYRPKVIDQKKGIRFIFPSGIIYEVTTEQVYSNRTGFNMSVDQSLKAINLTVEYLKQKEGEDGE